MKLVRWLGMSMLLLAAAGAASAQTTVVLPSPPQRCLTRGEALLGTPTYPAQALAEKQSARVTVELEFSAADAPPKISKLKTQADRSEHERSFESAVREFIEAYRVPCMKADETHTLRQEFVFVPNDLRGVAMMATQDDAAQRRQLACAKHPNPKDLPAYPPSDLRADRQGSAVLRAEFIDAGSAPRITVLDDGGSSRFAAAASAYMEKFRNPCHERSGPVDLVMTYAFSIQDGPRVILKDMSLPSLLRSIKGIRTANVYFDFNTMGCPFDIHFSPMQPHAPNDIGEFGGANPERRFFLDWLSRQQLDLPKTDLNAVLGQSARVSVPCTVLHLGTRSGGTASQ